MAPYGPTSSTTDGNVRYWNPSSTASTASDWVVDMTYDGTSTTASGGGWTHYPRVITKQVVVKPPKHWTKKIIDLFVPLINDETNTGWKITQLMREIEIVDPMIDVREMRDFLGLLKANASTHDCKKIDAFFTKHGLNSKPKAKKKPAKKSKR